MEITSGGSAQDLKWKSQGFKSHIFQKNILKSWKNRLLLYNLIKRKTLTNPWFIQGVMVNKHGNCQKKTVGRTTVFFFHLFLEKYFFTKNNIKPTNKGKIKFSNIMANKLIAAFRLLSNRQNYYIIVRFYFWNYKLKS